MTLPGGVPFAGTAALPLTSGFTFSGFGAGLAGAVALAGGLALDFTEAAFGRDGWGAFFFFGCAFDFDWVMLLPRCGKPLGGYHIRP
jgi:hypothetical protein